MSQPTCIGEVADPFASPEPETARIATLLDEAGVPAHPDLAHRVLLLVEHDRDVPNEIRAELNRVIEAAGRLLDLCARVDDRLVESSEANDLLAAIDRAVGAPIALSLREHEGRPVVVTDDVLPLRDLPRVQAQVAALLGTSAERIAARADVAAALGVRFAFTT